MPGCTQRHVRPRQARSGDVGRCIARLPADIGIPVGGTVLLHCERTAFLCVNIPLETYAPPRRRGAREPRASVSSVKVHDVRADCSLAFCSGRDLGIADSYTVTPIGADVPASSRASPARRSSTPRARHHKDGSALRKRVVVRPLANDLQKDFVLRYARAALRSVKYLPSPDAVAAVMGVQGVVDELELVFVREGFVVAKLVSPSASEIVVDAETDIVLDEEDVGERASSSTGKVAVVEKAGRKVCASYRAVCDLLLQDLDELTKLGAKPIGGVLLSGPPGVGKTSGVLAAAEHCGYVASCVSAGKDRSHGAPARALRKAFSDARRDQRRGKRVFMFVDEIDAMCPKREVMEGGGTNAEDNRSVAQLLTLMDGVAVAGASNIPLYVVGATNRPNALDPALRRPGRFDREVHLRAPDIHMRARMLQDLDPALDEATKTNISSATSGFVAGDLVRLVDVASKSRISFANGDAETDVDTVGDGSTRMGYDEALRQIRPSLLRGSLSSEVPNTKWSDIGGLEDVKIRLQMAVEWPLKFAASFSRLGLRGPRGVLLHGPPGCSKTTLVRAMACSGFANFLHMSGADVFSCYVGESERTLRDAFTTARAAAPSILFLDELDAIVGKRDFDLPGNDVQSRVLSTMLTEMDGLMAGGGVLVVGATNRLDMIDDALLRPGRFDEIIAVRALAGDDRMAVLRMFVEHLPLRDDVDLEHVLSLIPEATGAQLKAVCEEAALQALRTSDVGVEDTIVVGMDNFREAVFDILG